MKFNKKILLFILIYPFICSSQQESSNILFFFTEEQEIDIYEYNEEFIIRADYKTQSEALNLYPEQLIQSVFSASTQEWVNYNTLGGEEKATKKDKAYFDRIKNMDRDKNYIELIHKLSFELNSLPTVIIKFFLHEEKNKPVSGAMVMQKVDNRWLTTSSIDVSTFSIMVMRLKTEVLKGAFLGDQNNAEIQKLHERVINENGLDLNRFQEDFFSWYDDDNTYYKNIFLDPKAW